VEIDEFREIHSVKMVARKQHHDVAGLLKVAQIFAHSVGGSLIPLLFVTALAVFLAVKSLGGGQNRNETFGEVVKPVGLKNVSVQRLRSELGKYAYVADIMMQAV